MAPAGRLRAGRVQAATSRNRHTCAQPALLHSHASSYRKPDVKQIAIKNVQEFLNKKRARASDHFVVCWNDINGAFRVTIELYLLSNINIFL